MPDSPDMSQLKSSGTSETSPSGNWISYPNFNPGWTFIQVPGAGTLYLNYVASQLPLQIYVFHRNAPNTPINFGDNKIAVEATDGILYQLANPGTDAITLTYQMV